MSSSAPSSPRKVKVLGVCGGIGSGKSTACKLLVSDLGCVAHLDSDSIAHSVYAPGSEGVEALVQEFGTGILAKKDNDQIKEPHEIHRPALGAIVFSDPAAMKRLENIVWPRTKDLVMQKIKEIENDLNENTEDAIVIVEAAMLLDADWQQDNFLHGVWVVTSGTTALQRLMEQRGLEKEDAEKRLEAQKVRRGIGNLDEEVQNGVVTAVIENSSTLEQLKENLAAALKDPKSWYR